MENNLQQHEFENDIQRFMQIRDQVHEEIKKIAVHVGTLDATNKRFIAHFDVFEKLAKKSEDQMHAAIKAATHDLSNESRKVFSPLIESLLREQILGLNQSVKAAEKTLYSAMAEKNNRPFYYTLLGWLFLISLGFGIGSIISHLNTPVLAQEFIEKIDRLEYKIAEAFHKRTVQEKKGKIGKIGKD